jgi:hypothetical protein
MNIKSYLPGHRVNKIMKESPSGFVTGNLICHLDAGNTNSYPGSGTTWFDLSGNGNNGTLVGNPTFSSEGGGSFIFSSGRYVQLPSNILNVGSEGFAIEAWIRPTTIPGTNSPIFMSESPFNSTYVSLSLNNTTGVGINIGGSISFHNIIPKINEWAHIVGTRERGVGGSTQYYYIRTMFNARPPLTALNVSTSVTSSNPRIGGNPANTTDTFIGNIAVVRIYSNHIKSGEVWYNFNNQKNRFGVT